MGAASALAQGQIILANHFVVSTHEGVVQGSVPNGA
jgi:hypothetical protein